MRAMDDPSIIHDVPDGARDVIARFPARLVSAGRDPAEPDATVREREVGQE